MLHESAYPIPAQAGRKQRLSNVQAPAQRQQSRGLSGALAANRPDGQRTCPLHPKSHQPFSLHLSPTSPLPPSPARPTSSAYLRRCNCHTPGQFQRFTCMLQFRAHLSTAATSHLLPQRPYLTSRVSFVCVTTHSKLHSLITSWSPWARSPGPHIAGTTVGVSARPHFHLHLGASPKLLLFFLFELVFLCCRTEAHSS